MNIETTKLKLMHLLLQTQKESILKKVKKILEEDTDWWDEMTEVEQREIEIELGQLRLGQLNKGKHIEHREVMKLFDKWK